MNIIAARRSNFKMVIKFDSWRGVPGVKSERFEVYFDGKLIENIEPWGVPSRGGAYITVRVFGKGLTSACEICVFLKICRGQWLAGLDF